MQFFGSLLPVNFLLTRFPPRFDGAANTFANTRDEQQAGDY